jgi:hypothetical protein
MPAADDAVLRDLLALLMNPEVVLHQAGGRREPDAVASGQGEICAVGRKELAQEASRAWVDLGTRLVEARHPEMSISGERPGVVEVPAGPLLDQPVLLHVEQHHTRLQ